MISFKAVPKARHLLRHIVLALGMTNEEWRPVVGWEGLYSVSDQGRVWSVRSGRCLKPGGNNRSGANQHHQVQLCRNGIGSMKTVHRMVLEAFVGPCPAGMEACHLNDVGIDNRLTNLRWDSRSANQRDRVRNGRDHNSVKDRCIHGHEFTEDNTYYYSTRTGVDGKPTAMRKCKTCTLDRKRAYRARKSGMAA